MPKNAAFTKYALWRVLYVAQQIVDIAWRFVFTSRLIQGLRRWILARYTNMPWPELKVAMVSHVYYTDMMPEVFEAFSALPQTSGLFITTTPEQYDEVQRTCAGQNRITLITVPNRGRDVAPFLELLNTGILDEFDVVLKLHSKRSPHLFDGNLRRRMLFQSLAGNEETVKRVLYGFLNTNAGLIGASHSFRSSERFWRKNEDRVEMVKRRMRPTPPRSIGFFGGTMFWARVSALVPLKEANFELEEFEPEEGQLDGTLHHAIERVFGLSALAAGFDVRSISGKIILSTHEKTSLRKGRNSRLY